jgi:hypothetical protein
MHEAVMDQYLGWLPGSPMHSVYVHLSGRDVDQALLSMYGLETDGEDGPTLRPVTCPRCKEPCTPTVDHCPKCGSPTDPARLCGLEAYVKTKWILWGLKLLTEPIAAHAAFLPFDIFACRNY